MVKEESGIEEVEFAVERATALAKGMMIWGGICLNSGKMQ